ncbi:DUF4197 domain-containing protein [Compostibacter hankyongensis]|uniref:DUF4197 domain-containing protein n=1 Tax=Compostibacter hankyongensis TaxID=1007089 RepID=A0ABP8G635_9BACT
MKQPFRYYLLFLIPAVLCMGTLPAQAQLKGILDHVLHKKDSNQPAVSGTALPSAAAPSSTEISTGVKQALEIGLQDGIKQVSAVDGFFKNALIKVVFPPEAQRIEQTLRGIGLGSLCDKAILSFNRAAESAAKEAAPIFTQALKQMTLRDATQLLLGPDTAATSYFKRTTTAELKSKFRPVIESNLEKAGATRYWGDMMNRYNQLPLVKKVNPDLSDYVTQKAIDGLFVMVAEKEKEIRGQLGARTTPLLQKVFGYAAQQKGKE